MTTFRDIINQWPSLADFAADIGVEENTAKQMRTRNSVNARYWIPMVSAARRRRIKVTMDVLAAAYSRDEVSA